MSFKLIEDLSAHLSSAHPQGAPAPLAIVPELCPEGMGADITVNCFRFAKAMRQPPDKLAADVAGFLSTHPDVEKAEKVKAFVNVTLKSAALHVAGVASTSRLIGEARLPDGERKRILVEYSAPNTNKPLHLGHLRNNCLGMSLTTLLQRVGHEVTAVNLVNDRGIHICKSMIAYQRFGSGTTPESSGKKGDHLVGEFYVMFDKELRRQLKEFRDANPGKAGESDEKLFLDTEIGAAAQKLLVEWERGDVETVKLWRMMNDWVLAGFEQTYKRMGVCFDKVYFESETYKLGKDIALKGLESGAFERREDGAVLADLADSKLDKKVLLRADGTSVYITQDLGTTLRKYEDFHPDGMIWVVGDEQIHHFNTLFAILKKLGYLWAADLHHLAYGMVNLPSGRMKSREGTVVDADDLFNELTGLAKQATLERCEEGQAPADLDKRSETIAMGALKFMLLKFNPKTTMMFDPDASVKFEGDTGPYVQYACARINSIMRKAAGQDVADAGGDVDWSLLSTPWERRLSALAAFYPAALRQSAERLDCSGITTYLLDLAKAFSAFFRECPVLKAETPALRKARLALCLAARDVLADGLKTLTIDVPEQM